jgi:mannose-6-phosphate isomerase
MATEIENWLLVISGSARVGSFDFAIGDAIFLQSDRVDIHAGPTGMVALAAYTGGIPVPDLLQRVRQPGAMDVESPKALRR